MDGWTLSKRCISCLMASELLRKGCKCGLVLIVQVTNSHSITRSSHRFKDTIMYLFTTARKHTSSHNMALDSLTYTKSDTPRSTHGTNTLCNTRCSTQHFHTFKISNRHHRQQPYLQHSKDDITLTTPPISSWHLNIWPRTSQSGECMKFCSSRHAVQMTG